MRKSIQPPPISYSQLNKLYQRLSRANEHSMQLPYPNSEMSSIHIGYVVAKHVKFRWGRYKQTISNYELQAHFLPQ
jgi:hypothetical protein